MENQTKISKNNMKDTKNNIFRKIFRDNLLVAFTTGFLIHLIFTFFKALQGYPIVVIYIEFVFSIVIGLLLLILVWLPRKLDIYNNELRDRIEGNYKGAFSLQGKLVNNKAFAIVFFIGIILGGFLNYAGLFLVQENEIYFQILYVIWGCIEWPFNFCYVYLILSIFVILLRNSIQIRNESFNLKFSPIHPDNSAGFSFYTKFLFKSLIASLIALFFIVVTSTTNFYYTEDEAVKILAIQQSILGLTIFPIVIIILFSIPVVLSRSVTVKYKEERLIEISQKFNKSYELIRRSESPQDNDYFTALYYLSLTKKIEKIRDWPFSAGTFLKILGVGVSPLISYLFQFLF